VKRKVTILGIGVLLGAVLGYFAHGPVATGVLMKREPRLFSAFYCTLAESFSLCVHGGLQEQKKHLLLYKGRLAQLLGSDRSDDWPKLEYAFAEARLSAVQAGLNDSADSAIHMKNAQEQLAEIGWTDVSPEHIQAVIAQTYGPCSEHPKPPAAASGLGGQIK